MKKLLVLVSIVSLLAFAGSAFAADYDYDTIDDVVGHWTGTETDLVGHVNGTYGSGAYNRYLSEKAANAAINPSTTVTGAMPSDYSRITFSSSDISDGDSSAQTTLATGESSAEFPLGTLKKYKISKSSLPAKGKTAYIVLFEGITSTQATSLNRFMKLFADAATKTSNVAGIWLERVGTSATSSSKLNNNSTISTAAKGDAIVLCFTVDADSGETPVSGAAYDGTFAPALMTTGSAPSALLGSSGGGCALGTSALVLAVLGLFIAKRRG